jgi:hypothetical protein
VFCAVQQSFDLPRRGAALDWKAESGYPYKGIVANESVPAVQLELTVCRVRHTMND